MSSMKKHISLLLLYEGADVNDRNKIGGFGKTAEKM